MDDLVDNNNAVVQYQPSGIDHHLGGMLREGASSNPTAAWGNEAPPGSAFGDVNSAFRGMNLDQAQQPYDMLAMPQIPHLSHLVSTQFLLSMRGAAAPLLPFPLCLDYKLLFPHGFLERMISSFLFQAR